MEYAKPEKAVRMRLSKDWDESGNVMTISFAWFDVDSQNLGIAADPITFDRRKANTAMRDQAERHGWEQKHGDAAAIQSDKKSGKSATVAEKRQAILESVERFENPATDSWNVKAARGPVDANSLLAKLAALGYDVSKVAKPAVDVTAALNGEVKE